MGAQENKQTARDAYAAFSGGDAAGAMQNIDDSIEWVTRGDNALTGSYKGKQAVGELWAKLVGKGFRTQPHDFIADGEKVVVLDDDLARRRGDGERRRAHIQRLRHAGRLRRAQRPQGGQ